MQLILPLKHWQLFLILLFFYFFSTIPGHVGIAPGLIMTLIFWAWVWSIGSYGQKRLAAIGIASNSTGLLAFNIIYLCVFSVVTTIMLAQSHDLYNLPETNTVVFGIFQGYAIFALLHSIWFAARTLSVSVNDGKFSWESAVMFIFYLLLPIIGIWEIQPIVNKWSPKYWHGKNDELESTV
ncbi:hypothetical protein ACX0G7_25755 [Flavitalea antarctica]